MFSVELANLSAELSERMMEWNPIRVRVSKVIDGSTFELEYSKTPVDCYKFWKDDLDHQILSLDQKVRIYLQYCNASESYEKVFAFATALQELCDSGILLSYKGDPVVDIWVLNTNEFDVSDIIDTRVVRVKDPGSDFFRPVMSTYAHMDALGKVSAQARKRIRFQASCARQVMNSLKQFRESSYKGSVPHWWVAAIIEGVNMDRKERRMVHIDLCGAAYDDAGIAEYDGKLVSLHLFTTPEYLLLPKNLLQKDNTAGTFGKQSFVLEPGTNATIGKWKLPMYAPPPKSIRHLRSFGRRDTSVIAVSTLDTFLIGSTRQMPPNISKWYKLVAELRHEVVTAIPIDSTVEICNLEKRSELNGCIGCIHENSVLPCGSDRVAVSVPDAGSILSVKTTSIRLTRRKQYTSYVELMKKTEDTNPRANRELTVNVSRRDHEEIKAAVVKNPEMCEAANILMSGRMTISCYGEPHLAKGVRRILETPVFQRILPESHVEVLTNCLKVADHPKAQEAFKIMKLMKMAQCKAMEKSPSMISGNGAIVLGENMDFDVLVCKIADKIKQSERLSDIFEMLDRWNLFPNPVKQLEEIWLRMHLGQQ